MDIGSGKGYPEAALSNFSPHEFVLDGVTCASMEGFLQSLKYKGVEMQRHICSLVGRAAKMRGSKKKWRTRQVLYWQGQAMIRHSEAYQHLLDRAYDALAQNSSFRKALLATGNSVLTHDIGRTDPSETVLTRSEFCSRLMKIRRRLQENESERYKSGGAV